MKLAQIMIFLMLLSLQTVPLTELIAQVTAITTVDVTPRRIGPTAVDVRLLSWTATNSGNRPDTLRRVGLTSFMERTYAAKQYSLWAWDNSDSWYHLLESIRTDSVIYETNDVLYLWDLRWSIDPQSTDSFFVTMNANTEHILEYADDFDTTGVKIKIFPNDMQFRSSYSPTDSSVVGNSSTIENQRCITSPRLGGCYEIEFDTKIPVCSLLVFSDSREWYGAGATNMWDGCRQGTIDLGDTIAFRIADTTCFSHYSWTMSFADSVFQARNFPRPDSFRIDMSHYATGSSTPVRFKLRRIPVGSYQDTSMHWTLKYAIPDSVRFPFPSGVRVPIDTLAGLRVYATFRDSMQNWGRYITAWQVPVDTKRPRFDSMAWTHYYNSSVLPTSIDTVVSVGDSLSFTAVTTGTNFIPGEREVDSVNAHFYTCGFTEAAQDIPMADVGNITQNSNTIWFLKMKTEAVSCLRDLRKDSIDARSWVVFTAWDNGCNTFVDSVLVNPAIDLTPPSLSSVSYSMIYDADQNGCTNLGDSVMIRISLASGVIDVIRAYAGVLSAGIDSLTEAELTETSDSVWQIRTRLVECEPANAKDDKPLQRIGFPAVYPSDPDYRIHLTVVDVAGNTREVDPCLDGGLRSLDTRRPLSVLKDSVRILQRASGSMKLSWPRNSQDVDAVWFSIYSDSGSGGPIFYPPVTENAYGSTYDGESGDPHWNSWVSDPLPIDSRYQFSVRTVDDCGNFEFNTDVFATALCGDIDVSGQVDIADAVYLIRYIFDLGPAPMPFALNGDVDCDGIIAISDAVFLVSFIFGDGAPPCAAC